MRDAASEGAGLSFARVEVEGRLASKAVAFLRPLHMQPANVNSALNSLGRAGQADLSRERRTGGGAYAASGKRVLDLLLVLLSLPVVLPLVAVCAAALWLEGGRPFYTQARLGRGGQRFRILKLRTMVRDADQLLQLYLETDPVLRREWDETQKLKNDPRITRVGRFLRATSLDELPQLWNVAKGDMSLVGPRPMMPDQLPLYGDARAYFALRPGITGVWQVSVRNEGSFSSRARADADYRHGLSLGCDLALIWRTAGVVLKGTGY
ncbi:sugar transferase [Leisingera sp. ANG59]|uniref:sugar transferase n=1 Tax=Leisingera sp. ANG59 TaxID=2675221 RepID=UPI0015742C7A|nr:sugar transferase [Leisingera sp. ANG59]NSY40590.1 sugar transferase [Leisingera sp. ANG59]